MVYGHAREYDALRRVDLAKQRLEPGRVVDHEVTRAELFGRGARRPGQAHRVHEIAGGIGLA